MKLLSLALTFLISTSAFADRRHAPFHPHDDKRFDEIEDQLEENTEAASLAQKQARFVYDVAVDGGSSTSHDLDVDLPANAVVTRVLLYINTAFTDSGTGSLALQCGGTRDLMGYTDITSPGINSLIIGSYEDSQTNIPTGGVMIDGGTLTSSTAVNSVLSACSITAVVRGDSGYVPLTAGKLTGIVEYFLK